MSTNLKSLAGNLASRYNLDRYEVRKAITASLKDAGRPMKTTRTTGGHTMTFITDQDANTIRSIYADRYAN